MLRSAVFIDRDGTMARDVHYCRRPQDFELFPDVPVAIRRLNRAGFVVIVATNQSGVGRGYFTEDTLRLIHEKMVADLARNGARLDGVYYCPHHPDDNCFCRKPKPGLLFRAATEIRIDLKRSFMIGDMPLDVGAGRMAGCTTVLIAGPGTEFARADYVAADFTGAVDWILSRATAAPVTSGRVISLTAPLWQTAFACF